MFVDFNILNQLGSPSINSNTFANRPAAGQTGRLFVSTDTFEIYRDTGSGWDLIGGPGSSTITGSGTANTFTIFTGTNSIGDSSYLTQGTNAINVANSEINLPANNVISGTNYGIKQVMATNDYWRIYGNTISSDVSEMVLELGDNAEPISINGQRYRFFHNNTWSGTAKDVLIVDYENSTFNTNIIVNSPNRVGINTSTPNGLLHADGGASAARIILDADTGVARIFSFRTDNLPRWALRVDGAETGSNAGANFALRAYDDTGTFTIAPMSVTRATGEASFLSTKTYSSGNAIGILVQHNLTIPNAVNVGLAAIGGVNSNLNLTLGGSTTVDNTGRQGLEGSTSISFTGAGTLTMTQGSTVRAFSALSSVYAFNGSAIGTITHLAGLRICFPDNVGSAVNITNNFALLINDQTTGTGTVTYTNRWGVYQEGSSDLNYMAANLLLGSTTNSGQKLQVNGTALINNTATIGGTSVLGINVNGNGGIANPAIIATISSSDGNLMVYRRTFGANTASLGLIGQLYNSNSSFNTYTGIYTQIVDNTAGSEDGRLFINCDKNGTETTELTIDSSGLKTSTPVGGTAAYWKFGQRVAAAVALDATQYIELEVGGTLYKLAIVT